MSKFYRNQLGASQLEEGNSIVKLSSCLKLIEGSEYKDQILKLFDFESIKDEILTIRGLNTVINSVISKDLEFKKHDLVSHISNVSYLRSLENSENVILNFNNVKDSFFESNTFNVETAYSAKRDYFEGSYKMEKFASFCIKEGHSELIRDNINYLNEKYTESDEFIKSYRFLKDTEGSYFLRAITSVSQYHDYNIRFSLFVTIMALYNVSNKTGGIFSISYCEYSESYIKIFFQKNGTSQIPGIGTLDFALEMSNDEIKREAFKFSGVFTLTTNAKGGEEIKVFVQPKRKNLKTKLLSIRHNFLPETLVKNLTSLTQFISEVEGEMKEDLIAINKVKNPDHLRFFLQRKIEKSRNEELQKYRDSMVKTLDSKITKMSELLILMDKVNNLVVEFELKEYLRYLFYDILREGDKSK